MSRPLSLLIVEDREEDAELVVVALRRHGFDVSHERVDSPEMLTAALRLRKWDVVICDHGLPSLDSSQAMGTARELEPDAPFVILSGTIGEEAAVDALKAGAKDVVIKTNLARLGPVVERVLGEAENRRRQGEAERALLASEARKTAVLDSALDGVVTIDHEGRILDFNAAAEAMFGWTREEAAGRPMADLIVPPSLRGRHLEAFARHLATGESRIIGTRVELAGMRADGSEFPVELSITRGSLGGKPFFTGYIRDLTERKRAEAERASLEAQLLQAQKMEAIGRLAGGITHDFNNILAVVTGHSHLLRHRLDPEDPLRHHAEEIDEAAGRAAALTRQLLAFSRRQVLEPRVLDLNAVVAGIEPMLRRMIGEDVQLRTELDPGLGRVHADPTQIEQVILNLAVNARDAMPDGGSLALETGEVELAEGDARLPEPGGRAGRYAVLSVRDTGSGMDVATQAHIFEPFFTTKEVAKGTGLGLSTVYGIVEQSEGFVRVVSEPGEGATFDVHLPIVDDPVDAPEPAGPATSPAATAGSETILLVEDDDALLRLLRQSLEADGYTVVAARSGDEAIELAEREDQPIDLTISDVVMPGTSGPELGRELVARRPGMRLLFMSGYSEHGIGADERRELRAAFIQKPFRLDELSRRARLLLDRAEG